MFVNELPQPRFVGGLYLFHKGAPFHTLAISVLDDKKGDELVHLRLEGNLLNRKPFLRDGLHHLIKVWLDTSARLAPFTREGSEIQIRADFPSLYVDYRGGSGVHLKSAASIEFADCVVSCAVRRRGGDAEKFEFSVFGFDRRIDANVASIGSKNGQRA